MFYNVFYLEEKMLNDNPKVIEKATEYLDNLGINKELKGYKYMRDILALAVLKKKYSCSFFNEITPYIAYKYNIKNYSVQRQLRYTFTITNHYIPNDVLLNGYLIIKEEMENEYDN